MNGNAFLIYVEQVLRRPSGQVMSSRWIISVPTSCRDTRNGRHRKRKAALTVPYSLDFDSIEQLIAELKAPLRKAPRAPWKVSDSALRAFAMPSSQINPPSTSAIPDMVQLKWKLL